MAPKTDVIEQLRARIAELEEEILIERSNGDHWRDAYSKWVNTDESARRLIELQEQLAKAEQRVAEYNELMYAVQTKNPDETRHQTALRYIRNAENRPSNTAANCASS